MASLKRIAVAAGVISLTSMLSMCSGTGVMTGGNTVAITYDRAGEENTVTYTVPDAKCEERVTSTMRKDKPFGFFIAAWSGDHTKIEGWLNSDKFVLFVGEGIREWDEDTNTFTFTADGVVKETDSAGQDQTPDELAEKAEEYEGSITATVRCAESE